MYKYISRRKNTITEQQCKRACSRCDLCSKDTREYDGCWNSCDECNRCSADSKNSQVYDDPYEYRPWFLSEDNHSFNIIPYTKQYCDNVCGVKTCKKYREQYTNYQQCKRCQLQGKCWSPYQERCIDCGYDRAMQSCENKFGCKNPNGYEFANVPPINPKFNKCQICWDQSSYMT